MGPYMENESLGSSLGLVGVVGLVALVIVALLGAGGVWFRAGPGPDLAALSMLTLLSVLLGTVGGFGAIVAVVLPQIRSYNRISIYIGLFALAAVGVLVERGIGRVGRSHRLLLWGVSGALLVFGVWDQFTPAAVPDYDGVRARYTADRAFLEKVEAEVPQGASILQLPYMPWPEPGGPIEEMGDYEHFRAYLASSGTLRFSYGAMKGRETDAWQQSVAVLPPEQMLVRVRQEGFKAIWLDLHGIADDAALVASLRDAVGMPPLVDPSGRFVVFVLNEQ